MFPDRFPVSGSLIFYFSAFLPYKKIEIEITKIAKKRGLYFLVILAV